MGRQYAKYLLEYFLWYTQQVYGVGTCIIPNKKPFIFTNEKAEAQRIRECAPVVKLEFEPKPIWLQCQLYCLTLWRKRKGRWRDEMSSASSTKKYMETEV